MSTSRIPRVLAVLAIALAAPTAVAQTPVCITGMLEPLAGATICMQGETHRLAGTAVFLRSSLLDLRPYNGQVVRVTGSEIGLLCRVVDVVTVSPPPAQLTSCGSPMPGCPLRLRVGPSTLGQWALFGAFSSDFLPLGCTPPNGIDGTILLGQPTFALASGLLTGTGGDHTIQIPAVPALAGVRVWFQGARQDIAPVGPAQLTNVVEMQLVPFMPVCAPVNC